MTAPLFLVKAKWGSGEPSTSHACPSWAVALRAAYTVHTRMVLSYMSEWTWDGMSYPTQVYGSTRVATYVWITAASMTEAGDVPPIPSHVLGGGS